MQPQQEDSAVSKVIKEAYHVSCVCPEVLIVSFLHTKKLLQDFSQIPVILK